MAKKTGKPASKSVSALDILLKGSRQTVSTSTLSEQFSSVMSLANASIPRLMEQNPQMHISEARDLHARAQAMSVVIARQFREQRLTASVRQANLPPTGVKGLVDGPTYTDMFNPDWANHCPPDAIEATTSPVAYLADLYRYAKDLEATGIQDEVITLDQRRPDLKDLMLDHTALNRVEPTIVLVNEILEKSIRSHLDGIGLEEKSVDDALLEARYPNALPFERYTSQINYALGRKDRTLGDAIRAADPAYPYFKEPGVHSLLSDNALIQDTGFGPVQQGLLLEAPHFPEADSPAHPLGGPHWRVDPRTHLLTQVNEAETPGAFYHDNFGVDNSSDLEDTQTFCLRTGLSTDELEALLSVGAFVPSRSANVSGAGDVDGSLSGSVYINAGKAPAMGIETLSADAEKGTGARHNITHMTPDRVDRMNRMIRLARWLELPFDEVDQLLVASMQGEQRAAQAVRRVRADAANPWLISQNTLRALGLFQIVRRKHDVKAEDFAALLYGLNVYGRGKTPSQFDRVFNAQALFSIALALDDAPFTITPKPGDEAARQKIDHLCAALGITFETYRYVARVIEQTYAGEPLTWSREVVSAFYRLVRLPRYLGLSTIEALALLELLDDGGSQLVSKLGGTTQIASYYASSNTDTLSVIHALMDAASWLKEHRWSVAQLCRLVLPSATQPVATDAEQGLLQQMHTRLRSALITDSSFAQVGAPEVSVTLELDEDAHEVYVTAPIDWLQALKKFIDAGDKDSGARGLVLFIGEDNEESFEESLSAEVKKVLEDADLPVEELHPKITNMIMRARGSQEALLMEGLAGYLSTSADVAKALLFWSDGDRYQLLAEVLRVYGDNDTAKVPIGDGVLLVLDALSKRATLVNHLHLSAAFITQLRQQPVWFGLQNSELSMQLAYWSTQYAALLRLSEQDEDTLLDYFRLINTLWEGAQPGDQQLLRESAASKLASFLHLGIREVLALAHSVHPEGVIFTLQHLDTVARVGALCGHTVLDAKALLALHGLTPTRPVEDYRQAAELALSCLTDTLPAAGDEAGQSVSSSITVTPDYLVAQRETDQATYTITLRDVMDNPYEGVTIRWSTDLGELVEMQSVTDDKGVAQTMLQSGREMGVAIVIARFGLDEQLKAPPVRIDCDEDSIDFESPLVDPSEALSNKLEPIRCQVALVDGLGNKAADRAVSWYSTLGEFQRPETYTDSKGVAVAELRSREAGEAQLYAAYSNGKQIVLNPVIFLNRPYFQYVRFDDVVIEGIAVDVLCSLVNLDGTPRPDEEITWAATDDADEPFGELSATTSKTDANGQAVVTFTSGALGKVRVTATAKPTEGTTDKTTELTTVNPLPEIIKSDQSRQDFVMGYGEPIVFSVWVEAGGQAAVGSQVTWEVTKQGSRSKKAETTRTTRTDKDGKATFNATFTLGRHVVTATVSGTTVTQTFNVLARERVQFTLTISGDLEDESSPRLISRIAPYTLLVKAVSAVNPGAALEDVSFVLDVTGDNPALYGLDIEGLGEKHRSTKDGVTFNVSASPGSTAVEFTMRAATEYPLEYSEETYKLGWLYTYQSATLKAGDELTVHWVCVQGKAPPFNGAETSVGNVAFSVPDEDIKSSLPVKLKSGTPTWSGTPSENITELVDGDKTQVERVVALNGYLVMLKGDAPLSDQRTRKTKKTHVRSRAGKSRSSEE